MDENAYVPDVVPPADREYYDRRDRFGNRVGWGDRPALLVVDMTLAFTEDVPAVSDPCIAATERLLAAAREAGLPVVYATPSPAGTYPEGYPVTTKASPASARGPDRSGDDRPEWVADLDRIVPAVAPRADEPVVEKPRASAFFDTHLSNLLHYEGVDTLVVCGMTTSGCIRATVVDSHSSNFRTIVPQKAVADPADLAHETNLFEMDMKYADVTPLSEVLDRLGEYA